MRNRWTVVAYVVVIAVWVVLRASVFSKLRLIEFPDSESYLAKAAEPLWSFEYFFGSGRFFVVPSFYKLVFALNGPDKWALAVAQFLLSLGAWTALGMTLATRIRPGWLSVATLAAVLAFGLGSEVIQWDVMVLSESLSSSLFALLVAIWIRLSDDVSNARVAAVIVLATAWSMSREANSLLILPFAVVAVVWALWFLPGRRREQIRCGVLAVALVTIFAGTAVISGSGDRWVFPLLNVIGKRVLPTPERTAFYQAYGMPVNARLMDMAGEFASGKNWAFYGAPELEDFRAWLQVDGKSVFARDLATNPIRSLVEPLADVQEFVCPALSPYRYDPFPTFYRNLDGSWFCQPRAAAAIVAAGAILGIGLLGVAYLWRKRLSATDGLWLLTLAAMLLGWLPFVWFTWHVIGGMEVGRHEWSGVLMARVGGLLLLFYATYAAARRWLPTTAG